MICQKLLLNSLDNLSRKNTDENFIGKNNLVHIDSNVNINIMKNLNLDKNISNNKFDEKVFVINIEDIF